MPRHKPGNLTERDDLLAGAPEAQRHCKELVRRVAVARDGIDGYTADLIARVRSSDEGREGIRAFLEKRKPRWLTEADV